MTHCFFDEHGVGSRATESKTRSIVASDDRESGIFRALTTNSMTGIVVWFTGLPSSGKSRLAERVQSRLAEAGRACCLLDGDRVRELWQPKPGYGAHERENFYVTLGNLAAEIAQQGLVVLVAATASKRSYRDHARKRAPAFLEVWLEANAEECRKRDAKGLYARFARGEVQGLPGEDEPYEPPESVDVRAFGAEDDAALELLMQRLSS
ncbi:MAG: adenylyl-sulfate kinase [Polyangiaceae bacterium]